MKFFVFFIFKNAVAQDRNNFFLFVKKHLVAITLLKNSSKLNLAVLKLKTPVLSP